MERWKRVLCRKVKEWRGIQCCEIRAKKRLRRSSRIAVERRRRAAAIRVGEDLCVLLAGMNWLGVKGGWIVILTVGSAWT